MHSGFGPHIQDALQNHGRDLRLLIIKTSSLGDLCHTLPAIAGLRSALPKAHLTWLVNEEYRAFLEGFAPVDDLMTFDRQGFRGRIPSALRKLGQLVQRLQARRFHVALDFQGLLRSAAFSLEPSARSHWPRRSPGRHPLLHSQATKPVLHGAPHSPRSAPALGPWNLWAISYWV